MSDLPPVTREEWEHAMHILRRADGGVAGALVTCDNRLREQIAELRAHNQTLEARVGDQDNRIAGLTRSVRLLRLSLGLLRQMVRRVWPA